MFVPCIANVVQ